MLAVGAILAIIAAVIIWLWYRSARKLPYCNKEAWWPKAPLGPKAIEAGEAVIGFYEENPSDTAAGFGLPAYSYWKASHGGDYFSWLYTQVVIEYLSVGKVVIPDDWTPCVFDIDGDCPPCKELRFLRDALKSAIAKKPEMGTPAA